MTTPQTITPAQRIIVALDVDTLDEATELAEELQGTGVTFKIGNQLGTYEGWKAASEFAQKYGVSLFCDTKFKDIPTTVGKSSRAITRFSPTMFNIMADNSLEALKSAVTYRDEAVQEFGVEKPILLGVTVLTSIGDDEAVSIYGADAQSKVSQFAEAAAEARLDGVVCSSQEITLLKNNLKTKDLLLVTPGIRPEWAATNDQNRIMTPREAVEAGADYLVIGRPITQPPPEIGSARSAVEAIIKELEGIN